MAKNVGLWVIQVMLAVLFAFAGTMKLILPIEAMTEPVAFPELFLRFLGVAEVLGSAGLILPGLLRIHRELTPLAALGLVIIMIGATTITGFTAGPAAAAFPFVVGLLAAAVAYARWTPIAATGHSEASFVLGRIKSV